MFIPVSIGISIVKYHAMNIELIINRSIVYTLATCIIFIPYMFLVSISSYIFNRMNPDAAYIYLIIFTMFAAVIFSPLKKRLQDFVDKVFYRVKYNYRQAVKAFGKAIIAASDPKKVVRLLLSKIHDTIPAKRIAAVSYTHLTLPTN